MLAVSDLGLQLEDEDGRPNAVGTILGAMDPSELVRLADDVRALEDNPGWLLLEQLMLAHHRKAVHRMTEGTLSGIEAYAHSAGFVKGLKQTLAVRDHLLRTARDVAAAERNGEA